MREGIEGNLCRCTGYQNIVEGHPGRRREDGRCASDRRRRPAGRRDRRRRGKRKEDAHLITGRTTWTDNMTLPGHAAPGDPAQPDGARDDHPHRRVRRAVAAGRRGRVQRARLRRDPGHHPVRLAGDAGHGQPGAPVAWRSTRSTTPARRSPWSRPARKAEAQDALEAIDVDYEALPPVLDMEAALADGATLVHPDTRRRTSPTPGSSIRARPGRAARSRTRSSARRGDGQAALPPAAADPRVHGAALDRGATDRRRRDDVVGHPDPAHPAHDARRSRSASPSTRCGSSPPTSAADSAASCR